MDEADAQDVRCEAPKTLPAEAKGAEKWQVAPGTGSDELQGRGALGS